MYMISSRNAAHNRSVQFVLYSTHLVSLHDLSPHMDFSNVPSDSFNQLMSPHSNRTLPPVSFEPWLLPFTLRVRGNGTWWLSGETVTPLLARSLRPWSTFWIRCKYVSDTPCPKRTWYVAVATVSVATVCRRTKNAALTLQLLRTHEPRCTWYLHEMCPIVGQFKF